MYESLFIISFWWSYLALLEKTAVPVRLTAYYIVITLHSNLNEVNQTLLSSRDQADKEPDSRS